MVITWLLVDTCQNQPIGCQTDGSHARGHVVNEYSKAQLPSPYALEYAETTVRKEQKQKLLLSEHIYRN